MTMSSISLMDSAKLEKILLTKRIGQFLGSGHEIEDEPRVAVENVARALAQDLCLQVREALAFELRSCTYLPHDLAARIATDVESVAGPFLAATPVFSDEQLSGLIPHLAAHAHITLAKRADLGDKSIYALVTIAGEEAVTYLVRNDKVELPEAAFSKIVSRFRGSRNLMERLCIRTDLPLAVVEDLVSLVSDSYRTLLMDAYGLDGALADRLVNHSRYDVIWRQVRYASPHQVHAFVIDLKSRGRLSEALVIDMADRGSIAFLESAVALDAGVTLEASRETLGFGDMRSFVRLMQQAGFSKDGAGRCRRIITAHNRLIGRTG
ncbi:DUF2336 domain-containing protein [Kordiimonas marina]|uniref:DUF2336 domain-containing protein n=1 Tax=Kordiimonas marina TaxID=2872312 RepID=UPI001FF0F32D|nr:DUF2336 domain-containing protein [Kordiimonas marina]MCJ9428004.1 DUF2336 domain-containing protein [Kordiimonas marina]